jgi:hypothetical protein
LYDKSFEAKITNLVIICLTPLFPAISNLSLLTDISVTSAWNRAVWIASSKF